MTTSEWTAAQTALLEAGATVLASGVSISDLRLTDVTAAAGKTNGSFYHAWPQGIGEYRRALLAYVLSQQQVEFWAEAADRVKPLLEAAGGRAAEVVRLLGRSHAENTDRTPSFRTYISLWLRHDDPEVSAALREHYRYWTREVFAPLYDVAFDAFGVRLRQPFTTRHVAVAMTALAEGLALRRAVDPGAFELTDELTDAGWDAFGLLVMVFVGAVTQPLDSLDDRSPLEVAEDNVAEPPAEGRRAEAIERGKEREREIAGTIDEIVDALGRLKDLTHEQRLAVQERLGDG